MVGAATQFSISLCLNDSCVRRRHISKFPHSRKGFFFYPPRLSFFLPWMSTFLSLKKWLEISESFQEALPEIGMEINSNHHIFYNLSLSAHLLADFLPVRARPTNSSCVARVPQFPGRKRRSRKKCIQLCITWSHFFCLFHPSRRACMPALLARVPQHIASSNTTVYVLLVRSDSVALLVPVP